MACNKLNWITTQSDSDRYLYLTIMRDLKNYCSRGYCEIDITIFHFVDLPNSLIRRLLPDVKVLKQMKHIIIDWENYISVSVFVKTMIQIVTEINHVHFDNVAFNSALQEFTQYIKN